VTEQQCGRPKSDRFVLFVLCEGMYAATYRFATILDVAIVFLIL